MEPEKCISHVQAISHVSFLTIVRVCFDSCLGLLKDASRLQIFHVKLSKLTKTYLYKNGLTESQLKNMI